MPVQALIGYSVRLGRSGCKHLSHMSDESQDNDYRKLAYNSNSTGKKRLLGSRQTPFDAAPPRREQLKYGASSAGRFDVKQNKKWSRSRCLWCCTTGGLARNSDLIIIDKAGRSHNKWTWWMTYQDSSVWWQKVLPDAPHEGVPGTGWSTGPKWIEQARQVTSRDRL